jgi:DNA-binding Lrp family transcriptional regulator
VTLVLDARDRLIIALLKGDAWLTYSALAERVSLSASAVQRRVERLKEAGVILGARAEIAPGMVPAPLRLFVLVELSDDAAQTVKRFSAAMAKVASVTQCQYVTGEADAILNLELADMAAYAAFTVEHFYDSPLVSRFKTFAVLRTLK